MAWLLAEDKALKTRLGGITVSDAKNATRPVDVWFRWPDKELRDADWPFITMDLSGLQRSVLREQHGIIDPSAGYDIPGYVPDGNPDTVARAMTPVPIDLMYSVTTYARDPRHDRQLLSLLTSVTYLPFRGGWLDVADNGPDGVTERYMELVNLQKADFRDQEGTTVFRNLFLLRVSSELLASTVQEVKQALSAVISVVPNPDTTPDGTEMSSLTGYTLTTETMTFNF